MNKKWIWINAILLVAIIYFKYFNEIAAEFINAHNFLKTTSIFLVFYISIILLSNIAKFIYSKKHRIPKNQKNNVYFGVENIARFTITIGFFLHLLSIFGVNPLEFITSLTIVAAAIAIITKEYIVDYMSGLYLSFSNTFEINDYVKIADQKGKILEISMLKVKLLNDDDDLVIIPNSKVHYSEIINYTKRDVRLMNVDFQIALKYINNIEQLEKEIIASLRSFKEYIEPKSYNLKVVEMKMDYLDCKFQYTLILADMDMQRKIRRKTIREVFNFISSMKEYSEEVKTKS
jgi:small-conductance mechanosensitive channel